MEEPQITRNLYWISILANPLPAFSLPALSIFLNFPWFSLIFIYRNAQQHTYYSEGFLGVSTPKKVALVVCGFAPTKQTKVQMLQSQVQVQVYTSSFFQRVFYASCSPSSARRFSQDKTDKQPIRKASLSVDNSCCRLLWSAHEFRLWLPRGLPLEGLREGDIGTFLDIHCERSAIIAIVPVINLTRISKKKNVHTVADRDW